MSSGEDTGERNPFAPPPEGTPDQPWRPRTPAGGGPNGGSAGNGSSGNGSSGGADEDGPVQVPPPHPWSPGYRGGWSAPPQQPPTPPQPKFDPNDPVQRRSRYALSAGLGAMFCTLLSLSYVALVLGLLAVHWALSSLRAGRAAAAPAPTGAPAGGNGNGGNLAGWPTPPQVPAALGGLITGGIALLFTFAWFGVQLYYQDYLSCMSDALTDQGAASCSNLAPHWLVNLITGPQ
ncbi:hypothetical protein ACGFX4_05735 [Kitasatospora sp. NPDC048365]|uniref:hypothetical protein n=1 Tax=Kitasatospora sp. NPDC048365 TaxID=3364050 RepID=UPI0037187E69